MQHAPHQLSAPPRGAPALLRPWHSEGESTQERETDWFPELHFEMEHGEAAAQEEAGAAAAHLSA